MRVLVPLSMSEANQAVEALSERADSMRTRVRLGRARLEDVQAAIEACAAAETVIRDAFGFPREDWTLAAQLGVYDPSEGESFDPLPDVPLADPGDIFVYPAGVGR